MPSSLRSGALDGASRHAPVRSRPKKVQPNVGATSERGTANWRVVRRCQRAAGVLDSRASRARSALSTLAKARRSAAVIA